MRKVILISLLLVFIGCTKEKINIIVENNENKSIVNNKEKTIVKNEEKFYNSYEEYIIAVERYSLINEKLIQYLTNNNENINVIETYKNFIIVADKMFIEEVIPGYENIPEHSAIEEYDINLENTGKFTFITFDYNGKLLGKNIKHGHKRYLLLFENNMRASLYDQNNKMVYLISSIKYTFFSNFIIKASSEYLEKNKIYFAENCINEEELIPWVENSLDNGVGEYLNFIPQNDIIFPSIFIVISNGYVDYNKYNLYENNNRLKKLRIYNVDHDEYSDIDIMDTPNYQVIFVSFENKINKINMEILEVYQGDKYNDLCINLLKIYCF